MLCHWHTSGLKWCTWEDSNLHAEALPPQGSVYCQFHHRCIYLVAVGGNAPPQTRLQRTAHFFYAKRHYWSWHSLKMIAILSTRDWFLIHRPNVLAFIAYPEVCISKGFTFCASHSRKFLSILFTLTSCRFMTTLWRGIAFSRHRNYKCMFCWVSQWRIGQFNPALDHLLGTYSVVGEQLLLSVWCLCMVSRHGLDSENVPICF